MKYDYTSYESVNQVKNEMEGHVARMNVRCIQGFGGETWGRETAWESQA
jgi:hypothetical protein